MTPLKDQNIFDKNDSNNYFYSKSIDDKIKEIEERIKKITDTNVPDFVTAKKEEENQSSLLKERLDALKNDIKEISSGTNNLVEAEEIKEKQFEAQKIDATTSHLENSLNTLHKSIENLNNLSEQQKSEIGKENISSELSRLQSELEKNREDLHKKLFNSFYTENANPQQAENAVKEKLEKIDEQIKDIKNSISAIYNKSKEQYDSSMEERLKNIESRFENDKTTEQIHQLKHGPITIRPRQKKEGLFNDVNLTEDYELGFRFYQLGFKTGFFNVKLDKDDEATRIATAEFFPNTFWASVKQRSRWVAGIVFQNWKAHKWSGNLSTKYFLFRDRKSLFSFISAFLANIVILYFVFAILSYAFGWQHVNSLVGNSSVLWYLMVANLIFMISRLSHRFVFTYNWYGFKYAFFSIFRLPLDTFINFFAIARSIRVYRNTKTQQKVVWDSTSHY